MGLSALIVAALLSHDADVIYVSLESTPGSSQLRELCTLTPPSLALLAPIDVDGDFQVTQAELDERAAAIRAGLWDQMPLSAAGTKCSRSGERAVMRDGFVELSAKFTCPDEGALTQDFRYLSILPANYRVVLGSQVQGEQGASFAQGAQTTLHVPRPADREKWHREKVPLATAVMSGVAFPLTAPFVMLAILASMLGATGYRRVLTVAVVVLAGHLLGAHFPRSLPGWPELLVVAAMAVLAVVRAPAWSRGVGLLLAGACHAAASALPGIDADVGRTMLMFHLGAMPSVLAASLVAAAIAGLLYRRRTAEKVVALVMLALAGFWLVEKVLHAS